MRTVKAITGLGAAEEFYNRLGGAIRYILPAATVVAFMGLSFDAHAAPGTAPTDIDLNNLVINENSVIGTAVGDLLAIDIDPETHTYTLVAGSGDADNAAFSIVANKLQSAEIFNHEVKGTYFVRIAATGDDDGLSFEKEFTITIGDINDKPTVTAFSKSVLHGTTLTIERAFFEDAFGDEDGNALDKVQIATLPDYGTLYLSGAPVLAGDILSAADCDNLTYDAPANMIGIASFLWNAEDGAEFADIEKEFYLKIYVPRSGSATLDTSRILPSFNLGGFTIIGTRPGTLTDSLRAGSGTGGIRPIGGAIVDTNRVISKMTDEVLGIGSNEQIDLNITAFPNPFTSAAELRFTLPEAATVEVNVYNYMGAMVKQLVSGMQPAGVNSVSVGNDLSNGSYIYTVRVTGTDGQPSIYKTGSLVKIK